MKVSDYIVEFLISKGITDVFGYPGGMVTHLMDSFAKYSDEIAAHVTYHEQGAAFAACGYAQTSGKPGVAYATSGPGATNLVTGICEAYFDSLPTIFLTGQVNTNEAKGSLGVRQRGFQETDILSIVKPVTKYASYVDDATKVAEELETAYQIAMSGRRGPVLLDIPMNIFRGEIELQPPVKQATADAAQIDSRVLKTLQAAFAKAKAPVFLLGAGVKSSGVEAEVYSLLKKLDVPVVSSMIAFDVMKDAPCYYGFIGAYGVRTANFIVAKSDLIVSIGTRLDIRQVGAKRENFAPNARIVRFDIDSGELEYHVHENECQFCKRVEDTLETLRQLSLENDYQHWKNTCAEIRELLADIDITHTGILMEKLSEQIPEGAVITTDVGQNQVWVAQSFKIKPDQRVLFSGGHGAMGYSLPAAIGAYYGSGKKPVYCITGDGGMQMNIQELQFIRRENLPIKTVVVNNNALGMIRHFQEMYFDSRYFQTKPEGGYTSPDFARIAQAYGIDSKQVREISGDLFEEDAPELIELLIEEDTYVFPKLEFGKPNQDQQPLIDRNLYQRIMDL